MKERFRLGTRSSLALTMALLTQTSLAVVPGALDASFGDSGKVLTAITDSNDEAHGVVLQVDGKIVVAGHVFDPISGQGVFAVARYLSSGALDTDFGQSGIVLTPFPEVGGAIAQAVVLQADEKIVVGGYTYGEQFSSALARYLPDGSLDRSFSDDGLQISSYGCCVYALATESDGKIVSAGGGYVARYLAEGTLDPAFGNNGVVVSLVEQSAVALQPDGKIVTAGSYFNASSEASEFGLARFLPNGSPDTTFGANGLATTAFAPDGFDSRASAVTLQSDGKIIAAGRRWNQASSHVDIALARYLPNGHLDATYGNGGLATNDFGAHSEAFGLALQRDGKAVVSGYAEADFALARFATDGTVDATFGSAGLVITSFGDGSLPSSRSKGLVIQPNDRIVAAGSMTLSGDGALDFALARYASGLETSWGPPAKKSDCKNNGWRSFNVPRTFKNQGDCIRFVNRH